MKKLYALLLALVLVFGLTTTAFAAGETYTITINNAKEGHTYEAYQIFKGDLAVKDGSAILSNITWGSGVSEDGKAALGDAAVKAETLKTEAQAKAFAKAVETYLTTPSGSTSTVTEEAYVISGLEAGYYLVKDQNDSLQGDNDSYTSYILKVVNNVEVDPKSDVPEFAKKVQDINDSEDGSITDNSWQDSADHDINDHVPFKLTATLPDNVSSYETYKLVFHDTLSKGLTYDGNSTVVVKIGNTVVTEGYDIASEVNGDGITMLTITFADVKEVGATDNSAITVEYTATLNENAVIGSAGNPNKAYLEYSNNPNNSGAGNTKTGKTPEDVVIIFTYKTIVNKVDGDKNPLTGAEFTLEKKQADRTWKAIAVVKNEAGTTFTFSGLDDGDYRLKETTTPAGYNTIDPIYFTVTAEHEITSDDPKLTSLSATHTTEDGVDVTTGKLSFAGTTSDGSLSTTVVNKKGSELPSTGGMGTTVFYVIGGLMMAGAVVLLVTKKRMAAK